MIQGFVTDDGVPMIAISIAGEDWSATIDTGFNGDVELPAVLRESLNARYTGQITSALAGGQMLEEDAYLVDFPFDSEIVRATTTFVEESEILIGTNLLQSYRLLIKFKSRTVELEKE